MSNAQISLTAMLYFIAVGSDWADGYLARKMKTSSKRGAIFDAFIDFLFIGGVFLYFGVAGIYPLWVFALITFMFAQFAVSSLLSGVVYDPFGKYYGSLLYGVIGLTIVFSGYAARNILTVSLLAVTAVSLASRLVFLIIKTKPR